MFLWIWNALRGYVRVQVRGFSAERFFNLAVNHGIFIWDVCRAGDGISFNVSVKGFKMLKPCAKKTKCHMKITARYGCPFFVYRYRKRKLLAGGFLFFVAALYLLSSFVWLIDIQGNSRLRTEDILSFCRAEKLSAGVFKHNVDTRAIKNKLLDHFPDIAWADVHIKGTRATVRLAETIPAPEIVDRSTPCDIVAKKDGLISQMVTAAGTPLVKQNDVVRKGDLLVSGKLLITNDDTVGYTEYVRAYSEIWAKMYTEIRLTVPFQYTEKKYTGQSQKKYSLIFMGKHIILHNSHTNYMSYDKITSRKQISIGEDYPLPFILVTDWYREFLPQEKERDVSQAKTLAERMVSNRIIREFDFEADIIDKAYEFNQNADSLDIRAIITTNERIDQEQPITPDEPEQEADLPQAP